MQGVECGLGVQEGGLGVTLGCTVVMRVLHKVCVGWEGCPGVDCVGAGSNGGVKSGGQGARTAKASHDWWDTWAHQAADI